MPVVCTHDPEAQYLYTQNRINFFQQCLTFSNSHAHNYNTIFSGEIGYDAKRIRYWLSNTFKR